MKFYLLLVFSARMLGAASTFLLSIAVARRFGPAHAGLFLLALNVVTFLSLIARLGLDNMVLKNVVIRQAEGSGAASRRLVYQSVLFASIAGLALGLLVSASVLVGLPEWLNKPDLGPVLVGFFPAIAAVAVISIIAAAFQSLGRTLSSIFLQGVLLNLTVGLGVLFMLRRPDIAAVLYSSLAIGLAVSGLALLMRCIPKTGQDAVHVGGTTLLVGAQSFWMVTILQQLIAWSGQFIASSLLDPSALSFLVVAQQASMLVSIVLAAINMVYAPRFAVLHANGKTDELAETLRQVVKLMAVSTLPLIALLLVLPTTILSLFGHGFAAGATPLRILVVGQAVNALTGPVGFILMMTGHEKAYRNLFLAAAPLSAVLTVVLGNLGGLTGIASATAVSIAVTNISAALVVRRKLGIRL